MKALALAERLILLAGHGLGALGGVAILGVLIVDLGQGL